VTKILSKYEWGMAINMSSIAVKKDIVENYVECLKRLMSYQDVFMFLAALSSGYILIHEPRYLSLYRVHEQQVSAPQGTSLKETLMKFTREAVKNFISFCELRKCFPMLEEFPLKLNMLAEAYYNVIGLMLLGVSPKYVVPVAFTMAWRSLQHKNHVHLFYRHSWHSL